MEIRETLAIFLGILAGFLNLFACQYMVRLEGKLIFYHEIPLVGIQYLKNYQFFMIGDRFCLTIMDFAILYILVQGWPLSAEAVVISAVVALVWTIIWHLVWLLPSHRPDVFYPKTGVISKLGKIHLVYFGIQYALGFMGLWMTMYMWAGLRPLLWIAGLGLVAAGVYYAILIWDWRKGKFTRPPTQRG